MNYHCQPDEVLDLTFANISLYNAIVPQYGDTKEEEQIRADDPRNKEQVRKLLGLG